MALPTVPGQVGYKAFHYQSLNGRAVGKFTDENHLRNLTFDNAPEDYDRKIIDIYTQTSIDSNDFIDLINKSTPYYIEGDEFKWKIRKQYEFTEIVSVPASTSGNPNLGQDGQPFDLIFSDDYFQVNDVVSGDLQHAPQLVIVKGPEPVGKGFLYSLTYPQPGPIDLRYIREGIQYDKVDNSVGEFDQELSGLNKLGGYIEMIESVSAGYGVHHQITKWADERWVSGKDIIVYDQYKMNEAGKIETIGARWEPLIERMMRKEMLKIRKHRILYGHGGETQTVGSRQEQKKLTEGIVTKIRRYGNYIPLTQGQFSIGLLRDLFGSIFYRRVPMAQRRVKLYTNEAGIRLFRQANRNDLMAAGLTIVADSRFIDGSGQNMMVNYGFEAAWTMETGKIEVSHLMELDLPQMNTGFGTQNYSLPIFLALDISNETGGLGNIREIRKKGAPNMTWGYINGRQNHLGHSSSQGMQSSSMKPGYEIWMEDNADCFIEDLSKCVLIEQLPVFE